MTLYLAMSKKHLLWSRQKLTVAWIGLGIPRAFPLPVHPSYSTDLYRTPAPTRELYWLKDTSRVPLMVAPVLSRPPRHVYVCLLTVLQKNSPLRVSRADR